MVNFHRVDSWSSQVRAPIVILAILLYVVSVTTVPLYDMDMEGNENYLETGQDFNEGSKDVVIPWDKIEGTALHKIMLMEYDNLPFDARATKRGLWDNDATTGRFMKLVRAAPRRTYKRQVRFRQCYFNPISCFRK